jgi:hypothetical protein
LSGTIKTVLLLIAAFIGIVIVWKLVTGIIGAVLSLVVPLAVVLVVGYVIYLAIDRKALNASRRRYLP